MNKTDQDFVTAITKWRKQDTVVEELQKQVIKMRNAYKQRLFTMTNDEADAIFK